MSDQTNAPEITLTVTATVRIDPHLAGQGTVTLGSGQIVEQSSTGSGGQGTGTEQPKMDLQGAEPDLQRVIRRGSSSESQGTTTGGGKGELKGN